MPKQIVFQLGNTGFQRGKNQSEKINYVMMMMFIIGKEKKTNISLSPYKY